MTSSFVLKDRKAQSDLEKMFPGFIEALAFSTLVQPTGLIDRVVIKASMQSTKSKQWHFSIPIEDIEIVESYRPHVWNSVESVPPEGVPMCVELEDQFGHLFRRVGVYNKGTWNIQDAPISGSAQVKRFRSWE